MFSLCFLYPHNLVGGRGFFFPEDIISFRVCYLALWGGVGWGFGGLLTFYSRFVLCFLVWFGLGFLG